MLGYVCVRMGVFSLADGIIDKTLHFNYVREGQYHGKVSCFHDPSEEYLIFNIFVVIHTSLKYKISWFDLMYDHHERYWIQENSVGSRVCVMITFLLNDWMLLLVMSFYRNIYTVWSKHFLNYTVILNTEYKLLLHILKMFISTNINCMNICRLWPESFFEKWRLADCE